MSVYVAVSAAKSVSNAASSREAILTARLSRTGKLTPLKSTKLLGTPTAGGRTRCVRPQRVRLGAFLKKAKRIKVLRKSGVNSQAAAAGRRHVLHLIRVGDYGRL